MLFSLLRKQHGRKKLLKKADKILRNKQNKLLTQLWGTRRSVWQSMRKNKNTPRRIFLDYNQWRETEARLRKSHSVLFKNFYQRKKGKEGVRRNVSRITILTAHTSLTRWGEKMRVRASWRLWSQCIRLEREPFPEKIQHPRCQVTSVCLWNITLGWKNRLDIAAHAWGSFLPQAFRPWYGC